MSAQENLNKAYTAASTLAGTNWAGSAATDSFRDQLGSPDADVFLTEDQRKFVMDRVVDEATLLKQVRYVPMKQSKHLVPRISVGTRIARASTAGGHLENTTMGAAVAPDFTSIELTSSKVTLPYAVSREFYQDNPEGGAAEATIAEIMSTQLGNDLEDLAVNGDEMSGDALLRANDGYTTLGAGANVKDFNGAAFTSATFELMLRKMPQKYRHNKTKLRFFVPSDIEMDWIQTLAARFGDAADSFLTKGGATAPPYGGIPVVSIAHLPSTGNVNGGSNESTCYLSDPMNMLWGVQQQVEVLKTDVGKTAIDTGMIFYAMSIRCDYQIANLEAFVLGKEITPRVA